jgi:hypothetical protein
MCRQSEKAYGLINYELLFFFLPTPTTTITRGRRLGQGLFWSFFYLSVLSSSSMMFLSLLLCDDVIQFLWWLVVE